MIRRTLGRRRRAAARDREPRRRLAVVLSGGATRGAFQIGVIDVLARRGIVPDLLVGTSVGAVNAAYWAFHPGEDVGERLLAMWQAAGGARVLPDRPFRIVGNLIGSRLHERSGLARILERALPAESSIESAGLPLHIVACNLRTGEATDLDRGQALRAVLASAAVPGVFAPVTIDGDPYVDGGVVANCPIDVAGRAGATDVLAVDLVGDSGWVPNGGFGTIERALTVALANQTRRELDASAETLRVAVLRPKYGAVPGFGDFTQTLALYRAGRLAAEAFLAEHWLGAGEVKPGEMDFEAPAALLAVPPRARPRRRPRPAPGARRRRTGRPRVTETAPTT